MNMCLFWRLSSHIFALIFFFFDNYRKVLATLDKTRVDAKIMKKGIKTITGKYEDAQKKTSDLLRKLTSRATALEKLKAKVGLSKSLDAYLHLNELEVEEEDDDELLKEG